MIGPETKTINEPTITTVATTNEGATPTEIVASEVTIAITPNAVIQRRGEAHGDLRSTATSSAIRSRVVQCIWGCWEEDFVTVLAPVPGSNAGSGEGSIMAAILPACAS